MNKALMLLTCTLLHHFATSGSVFHADIVRMAKNNTHFRHVLATANHSQVVLMSLLPHEDIGIETHDVDQTLIFVEGKGIALINGQQYTLKAGDLFFIPAGTQHNFTNTGKKRLKLFTIYAPAEHPQGLIIPKKTIGSKHERMNA
jgi:mannose-6-phosphate isomerase-like protein (cupin superfamily)